MLLVINPDACKKRNGKELLSNFKMTIAQLEKSSLQPCKFLKEIYYKIGLRIIEDNDELVQIKNGLSLQIKENPVDTENFKLYYLCNIKLSKFFRSFDHSKPFMSIIDRVLVAESNNVYFLAERIWINFASASDKK